MSSWDRPHDDRTQRLPSEGTEPESEPVAVYEATEAWEGDVPVETGPSTGTGLQEDEPPPEPRSRAREAMIGLGGALLGFVLAFVVVALGTSGDAPADDGQLAAAQERIETLEAELAQRDAAVADLEAQRDELETRLAEAEVAAGEGAADVEAQRQALDERAAALDERAAAIEEREAALDQREAELGDTPPADPAEPGEGLFPGDGLPELDGETADTIVDRIIEELRDLLPGGGT